MMKFKIVYYEDFFTSIASTIVECNDESELSELADKYYKENLAHLDSIAGANWNRIEWIKINKKEDVCYRHLLLLTKYLTSYRICSII